MKRFLNAWRKLARSLAIPRSEITGRIEVSGFRKRLSDLASLGRAESSLLARTSSSEISSISSRRTHFEASASRAAHTVGVLEINDSLELNVDSRSLDLVTEQLKVPLAPENLVLWEKERGKLARSLRGFSRRVSLTERNAVSCFERYAFVTRVTRKAAIVPMSARARFALASKKSPHHVRC